MLFFLMAVLVAQSDTIRVGYDDFYPSAAAHDKITGPRLEECTKAAPPIDMIVKDCYSAEYDQIDAKLNREYQAALRRLKSATRERELRKEQRQWLRDRWKKCESEYEGPGTLDRLVYAMCAHNEMVRRTVWLSHYGRR